MIYPILALIWLGMAVAIFYFQATNPSGRFYIPKTHISFAWVAVLFFVYNIMRWWSYSKMKRIRDERHTALRRHFAKREKEVTPDPEFRFDDEEEDGSGANPRAGS